MRYLPAWEAQALSLPHTVDIRFLPPLPRVITPALDEASGTPEIVDLTAVDAESEDAELLPEEPDRPAEAEQSSVSARVSRPTEVVSDWLRPVHFVGVTGPSGVGKSTLISNLLKYFNTPIAEVEYVCATKGTRGVPKIGELLGRPGLRTALGGTEAWDAPETHDPDVFMNRTSNSFYSVRGCFRSLTN